MNLAARMTLDTTGFVNPLRGAIGSLAGLIGISTSVAGAIAGVRAGLQMGGELSDLKARTGAAVKDLVVLRQAFEDTGIGAGQLPTAIQYLQRSLSGISEEGKPTQRTFAALGLDMQELAGLPVTDQLDRIGKAINGLGSEADKTEAAMTIFGRSGAAMKQLFTDPDAIERARAGLGSLPWVLDRNAALLDSVGDAFGRLKTQTRGLFVGVASELAPILKSITDSFNAIDLTRVGQQIGRIVSILAVAFQQGKLTELISLSIGVGVKAAFAPIASIDFWAGLVKVAIGAFAQLGAFLIEIFATPLAYFQAGLEYAIGAAMAGLGKIPGVGKVLGLQGAPMPVFSEVLEDAKKNNIAVGLAHQAREMTAGMVASGGAQIRAAFADAYAAARESESGQKLAGLLADLNAAVEQHKEGLLAASAAPATATAKSTEAADAPATATATSAEAADASAAAKLGAPDVDRWARIGMFIGPAGGPSVDYNRRTATATERLAQLAARTNELLARFAAPGAAAWS
ncbi:hypothetical protein [Thermosphaera sp.]